MKYDELGEWAEKQFREVLDGDVILDNGQVSRIDQIIDDAYYDVMDKFNREIRAGTNPESGLHGLPHIPWDEKIDGIAAMHGGGGVGDAVSRSGAQWVRVYGDWVKPRDISKATYKNLSPRSRYTCSGFVGAAIMLIVLCGLTCGCVSWLEGIAP